MVVVVVVVVDTDDTVADGVTVDRSIGGPGDSARDPGRLLLLRATCVTEMIERRCDEEEEGDETSSVAGP